VLSASITSLNARRSASRPPGEAMKTWINLDSGRDVDILWSTPLLLAPQDNPEAFVSE
jgi:hypothetical protein